MTPLDPGGVGDGVAPGQRASERELVAARAEAARLRGQVAEARAALAHWGHGEECEGDETETPGGECSCGLRAALAALTTEAVPATTLADVARLRADVDAVAAALRAPASPEPTPDPQPPCNHFGEVFKPATCPGCAWLARRGDR